LGLVAIDRVTAKQSDNKARGRAAHPGSNRSTTAPTLKGLKRKKGVLNRLLTFGLKPEGLTHPLPVVTTTGRNQNELKSPEGWYTNELMGIPDERTK
jgi:hypothetical protein